MKGEGWSVELRQGEYAEVPAGEFDLSSKATRRMRVWLLTVVPIAGLLVLVLRRAQVSILMPWRAPFG